MAAVSRARAAALGAALALLPAPARPEIVITGQDWEDLFIAGPGPERGSTADGMPSIYFGPGGTAGGDLYVTVTGAPGDEPAPLPVRILCRTVGSGRTALWIRNRSIPAAPGLGFLLVAGGEGAAWSAGRVEAGLPPVPRAADPWAPFDAAALETRVLGLPLRPGENRLTIEPAEPFAPCAGESCAGRDPLPCAQIFEIVLGPGDASLRGTVARIPRPEIRMEPEGGPPPLRVDFDGEASWDPDGEVVAYRWDFDAGDGIDDARPDAEGPGASHTYREPGRYAVTLTVLDEEGHPNRTRATVQVYEAPRIDPAPPEALVAYAGLTYAWPLRLTAGIPEPAWRVVRGPPGLTVDPDGWVHGWTPDAEDVGPEPYAMHVRALNTMGQDTCSWSVSVLAAFEDDFETDPRTAGKGWAWRVPAGADEASAGVERVQGDSAFVVRLPGEFAPGLAFDHGWGFDRVPRLVRFDMGAGAFQFEAEVRLLGGTEDGPGGAGLVVELEHDGGPDLLLYGFEGTRGPIRFERTDDRSPRSAALDLGGRTACLKVQRDGDAYRFFARRNPADPWIFHHELTRTDARARAVGLFARTRDPEPPALRVAFDDVVLGSLPSGPPRVSICTQLDRAWVGEEYLKAVTVTPQVPGEPYEIAVVEGPPGLSVSPDGIVFGWTPGPEEEGAVEHIELEVASAGGFTTVRWRVEVARRGDPLERFSADPLASGMWTVRAPGLRWSIERLMGGEGLRIELQGVATPIAGSPLPPFRLLRHDMGEGDFAIETRVRTFGPFGGAWAAGLVVAFGESDWLLWGPWKGGGLAALRGTTDELLSAFPLTNRVDLRIRKDCGRFFFQYRRPTAGSWTLAGEVPIWKPVVGAGIFVWNAEGHGAPAEFEWFDLQGGGAGTNTGWFRRGDAGADGSISIADAIRILLVLFQDAPPPACPDAADTDDDGLLTIGDAVGLLAYLFAGGDTPPLPGPIACGPDPSPDSWPASGCVYPCP